MPTSFVDARTPNQAILTSATPRAYNAPMSNTTNSLQKLLDFLIDLEHAKIFFRLDRCRDEAIMVRVDVPGARWEIEFFANGQVETEVFNGGSGVESGERPLERLIQQFSD
jgi:hypothetical protein